MKGRKLCNVLVLESLVLIVVYRKGLKQFVDQSVGCNKSRNKNWFIHHTYIRKIFKFILRWWKHRSLYDLQIRGLAQFPKSWKCNHYCNLVFSLFFLFISTVEIRKMQYSKITWRNWFNCFRNDYFNAKGKKTKNTINGADLEVILHNI